MSSLLSKFIQQCTTNAHQTVSGLAKKPCTHSGLEKNREFQLILNLGKQLSHSFCLSGQQHVYVLVCFNYWFSWKMTSFNPVANQTSEFQNYWPGKKISSSRTTYCTRLFSSPAQCTQNHYTFLGNCPPTPPLSSHFAISDK